MRITYNTNASVGAQIFRNLILRKLIFRNPILRNSLPMR